MKYRGRLIALTALGSILSGLYWFAYMWIAYGATAADYRPGSEPSDLYLRVKAFAVFMAGPLIYGLLIWGWRRVEQRLTSGPR